MEKQVLQKRVWKFLNTRDKSQRLKFSLNETYRKDKKITANFEPSNDEDVINKANFDITWAEVKGHTSVIGKDSFDFMAKCLKSQNDLNFWNEITLKTTIRILYNEGAFDNSDDTDEVPKD